MSQNVTTCLLYTGDYDAEQLHMFKLLQMFIEANQLVAAPTLEDAQQGEIVPQI